MAQAKSLTQQDIDKVLTYIASNTNATRNRAMFLLTILAGLRVSEVAQLTLGDVRNSDGTVTSQVFLSSDRVKHGHARTVFLSTQLQHEIAQYLATKDTAQDDNPLFHTLRGVLNRYQYLRHFPTSLGTALQILPEKVHCCNYGV